MQLSKRLLACCQFVKQGDRVADIGCDHGYLGIHLLKNGLAQSVIAADINEGPLQSAIRNANKYGVADNMRFFLSDGAVSIPREFDTMIIAGMGGDTIISILEASPWLSSRQYRLILQCQSKTPVLRKYLARSQWHIQDEVVVRDGRFLYTVMDVVWRTEPAPLTTGQQHFSPPLLRHPGPETAEYYQRLLFSLRRAIHGRGENADPEMIAALKELEPLENEFLWLKEAPQWQP